MQREGQIPKHLKKIENVYRIMSAQAAMHAKDLQDQRDFNLSKSELKMAHKVN
jgi:hypothetical protein